MIDQSWQCTDTSVLVAKEANMVAIWTYHPSAALTNSLEPWLRNLDLQTRNVRFAIISDTRY